MLERPCKFWHLTDLTNVAVDRPCKPGSRRPCKPGGRDALQTWQWRGFANLEVRRLFKPGSGINFQIWSERDLVNLAAEKPCKPGGRDTLQTVPAMSNHGTHKVHLETPTEKAPIVHCHMLPTTRSEGRPGLVHLRTNSEQHLHYVTYSLLQTHQAMRCKGPVQE